MGPILNAWKRAKHASAKNIPEKHIVQSSFNRILAKLDGVDNPSGLIMERINKKAKPKKSTQVRDISIPNLWVNSLISKSCSPHRRAAISPKNKDNLFFSKKWY